MDQVQDTATSVAGWKLVLFFERDHNEGLMLTVESAPGTLRPIILEPSGIFDRWQALDAASGERWSFLLQIVCACESRYPLGAGFGRCLFVRGENDFEVHEDFHPDLLAHLPRKIDLLGTRQGCPMTAVPLSKLSNAQNIPCSMTFQTSLVVFEHQLYIAKGPTESDSIDDIFSEVRNLSSLPKHRSIIEPPLALVTVSSEDDRLLGYLLKYYPNGNVRDYAISSRSQLSIEMLCKWSAQIAGVLGHLLYKCGFSYVDIKPDNFLVDEDQNLVLADFSNEGCTNWIAPPELYHGYELNMSTDGKEWSYTSTEPANTSSMPRLLSIPTHWPPEAGDKAMVYSVGRSLWMIWETIPADKFTMAGFHATGDFDPSRTVFTESTDLVPQAMKDMVLRCVHADPKARPTLAEVESLFGKGP
ncbi:MAG: hypothetical protein M4579_005126 [Chaenotheca gracillima]|nr:MAG: hypothetical protein M4579_005126 [Chaenotheca gracillima]